VIPANPARPLTRAGGAGSSIPSAVSRSGAAISDTLWEQEVAGSNPAAPMTKKPDGDRGSRIGPRWPRGVFPVCFPSGGALILLASVGGNAYRRRRGRIAARQVGVTR
jgi:hypothetical protein